MMKHSDIAKMLYDQHRTGVPFRPLDDALGVTSLEEAYAVQEHYVSLLRLDAGDVVGYKIGLTSKRMQALCGIDNPVAGVVLARRMHASGVSIDTGSHGRLGLEFEIGVRIGRDVEPSGIPYTQDTITEYVSGICPAVEMIDDRGSDYSVLNATSLVADNSWNAGVILGSWSSDWPPLESVHGRVFLDGVEVDSGHGRDVLGHPFGPLAWLANHLAARGGTLKAGNVVLTGSLVVTRFPKATASYRYELEGIGTVEFHVA